MSAKFSSSLPDGEGNGLSRIVAQLVTHPHKVHAAVVLVDCKKITVDNDTGETVPTARIRRIEVITGEDKATLRLLLDRAYDERSGKQALPLELERDLRAAFDGLHVDTGELPPSGDQQ